MYCEVLKREAEGLERPPHPGPLGQRIYQHISKKGWQCWLERLAMIINENRLSSADPKTIDLIESRMVGFLFGEGEMGRQPPAFTPSRRGR